MTSKNASMNHDDAHSVQLRGQSKMLNLERLPHRRLGKIWTLVDYWTIQDSGRIAKSSKVHLQPTLNMIPACRW